MRRELVIAAGPGEWRAALLEDAAAVELFVERGEPGTAGSVHLGRVAGRAAGVAAVLVDIGEARPGFLAFGDMLPRVRPLDDGARVLVQVRQEAQRDKAARLSMRVALRGRWLRLTTGAADDRFDERVGAPDQARLRAAAAGIGACGLSLDAPRGPVPAISALAEDAAALARRWRELSARSAQLDPPARLAPAPGFAAALGERLGAPPARVIADDPAALAELRAAFPAAAVAPGAPGGLPLDIDALFEAALSPSVALAGGGLVHIEETRAATMIDVDTAARRGAGAAGEGAALAANLAAAAAAARQIRLRHLAGAIVIDFVGMEGGAPRERVRAALAGALAPDPALPRLLGWTRLGHLEIVRPRRCRSLAASLTEEPLGGAPVKTAITIAHEALRALARAARAEPAAGWRLVAAAETAAALYGEGAAGLRALEARLGRRIAIASEPGRPRERFEIVPV